VSAITNFSDDLSFLRELREEDDMFAVSEALLNDEISYVSKTAKDPTEPTALGKVKEPQEGAKINSAYIRSLLFCPNLSAEPLFRASNPLLRKQQSDSLLGVTGRSLSTDHLSHASSVLLRKQQSDRFLDVTSPAPNTDIPARPERRVSRIQDDDAFAAAVSEAKLSLSSNSRHRKTDESTSSSIHEGSESASASALADIVSSSRGPKVGSSSTPFHGIPERPERRVSAITNFSDDLSFLREDDDTFAVSEGVKIRSANIRSLLLGPNLSAEPPSRAANPLLRKQQSDRFLGVTGRSLSTDHVSNFPSDLLRKQQSDRFLDRSPAPPSHAQSTLLRKQHSDRFLGVTGRSLSTDHCSNAPSPLLRKQQSDRFLGLTDRSLSTDHRSNVLSPVLRKQHSDRFLLLRKQQSEKVLDVSDLSRSPELFPRAPSPLLRKQQSDRFLGVTRDPISMDVLPPRLSDRNLMISRDESQDQKLGLQDDAFEVKRQRRLLGVGRW
jgi:hypothetical protein